MVPISFGGRLKLQKYPDHQQLQLCPQNCCYHASHFFLQINLLTTVMSDVPVLPDEDDEDALPMLMDSPQCVAFGIFVIWWVHTAMIPAISHNKRREVGMGIKLPKAEKKWEFIIVSRVFKISAANAITQLGIRPKQYLGASSPWGIERRDKFIFCKILSRKTLKF